MFYVAFKLTLLVFELPIFFLKNKHKKHKSKIKTLCFKLKERIVANLCCFC